MRVGIYGGTFDPPHIGHIRACESFINELELDRVYVMPAYIPPHKTVTSSVDPYTRFEMSKLAFNPISYKVIVSDLEIRRKGRSYTADTIRYFAEYGSDNEVFLLCGTDMLLTLDTWYMPEYIFSNSTIVHVLRSHEDVDEESTRLLIQEKYIEYKKKYRAEIITLDEHILELSSTTIREAISSGKDVEKYLTPSVSKYIKENNLYKNND